jgi:hypothetical protein
MSSNLDEPTPQRDSGITDDLSIDRDSIRRIEWVFERILAIVPAEHKGDMRVTMMKTMMRESLKDLALIPDRIILPMIEQIAGALNFVVNGTMAELEEALAAERDNAEEG